MFETHHLVIYHVNLYLEAAAKKEMDFLFKKMHFQQVVAIQCSEEATSMSSKTVWHGNLRLEKVGENEPRKKPSYFPLNPGKLSTGSLFHGLWNNSHITG